MPEISSLPGFRDFFPDVLAVRSHIMAAWREVSARYGFEEYDAPPLEPLELYVEKSGEEIVRQLYSFEDKGGRPVALRPEMTPSFARLLGARARALPKPIRWFSIPQLFRYERMQRGRLREHFQWNVDLAGEADIAADAEVLAVALDALRHLGLTAEDVVARVSDRRVLEKLLLHAGVPEDQLATAYAIIDKLEREEEAVIRQRLAREAGLASTSLDAIFAIFEHGSFEELATSYAGVAGVDAELDDLRRFFRILDDFGLAEFVRFDPTIVRGLAYYTGVVYEIFDRRGELRAICGGGRYDQLLGALGGVDLPALGFGMGDVVLSELLSDRGLLPSLVQRTDYYLVAVGPEVQPLIRLLARRLRDRGHSVLYALRPGGVGRQFREAHTRGAQTVIVIGPDELRDEVAVVRDMGSGSERRIPLQSLLGGPD